jgi:hypothetical protein
MATIEITPDSPPEPTPEELEKVRKEFARLVEEAERQWTHEYVKEFPPPKIVYCMTFYEERMPQVKRCIEQVRPYVDRCVLVYDDTVTEESKKWLEQWNCELYYRKWDNHFSKQRNAYLEHVNEGEWVLVSDPDELFCMELLKDLHTICLEAEKRGINILGINAHDITIQLDGTITETVSDWFKQLLFKYEEGVRYVGCVHETLLPGVHGWRPANLDRRYYYEHVKSMVEIKERGARNVFCGGGGNNVKDRNPMYVELHKWADKHGIKEWPALREYIRKGNIDPELLEIIIKHRNDSGWDWENESRDFFLWLKAIHPDLLKDYESTPQPPSKGSPPEVMAYVEEQYLKILGRNADDVGKQAYTKQILEGKIKREDLPKILMGSQEYRTKHGL